MIPDGMCKLVEERHVVRGKGGNGVVGNMRVPGSSLGVVSGAGARLRFKALLPEKRDGGDRVNTERARKVPSGVGSAVWEKNNVVIIIPH